MVGIVRGCFDYGDLEEKFLKNGADPNITDNRGMRTIKEFNIKNID